MDLSLISILLLDFLFIQFKSSFVYNTFGAISCRSAFAASAIISAIFFVVPLALKNATNFLHIIQNLFPCVFFTEKNRCIRFTFILHIYFKLHRFIMSNAYIEFCFMPEKHLFLLSFYGLPANMGCSVSRRSQCLS